MVSRLGLAPVTVVAGSAADNVAQVGGAHSRVGFNSAVVAAIADATLAAGQNVVVTATIEHRQPGGAWSALSSSQVTIGATGAQVIELDVDLVGALSELRVSMTANPSNTVTDTCEIAAVLLLGEAIRGPV